MRNRVQSWLSDDNLKLAQGKTRQEIFDLFGNDLKPVAYIPKEFMSIFRDEDIDNHIYSGEGYFIDHAVNHHPEVLKKEYGLIQDVINNHDHIKKFPNQSVAFTKMYDKGYAVVVRLDIEGDKLILHKSFFWKSDQEPYKNTPEISLSEGGVSSISHTKSYPADTISTLDRRNKESEFSNNNKINKNKIEADGKKYSLYTSDDVDETMPYSMPLEFRNEIKKWDIISRSPYSFSFYDSNAISWDFKPHGSLRIADHWNFSSQGQIHCETDKDVKNGYWTLARYNRKKGLYEVIKSLPKAKGAEALANFYIYNHREDRDPVADFKKEQEIKKKVGYLQDLNEVQRMKFDSAGSSELNKARIRRKYAEYFEDGGYEKLKDAVEKNPNDSQLRGLLNHYNEYASEVYSSLINALKYGMERNNEYVKDKIFLLENGYAFSQNAVIIPDYEVGVDRYTKQEERRRLSRWDNLGGGSPEDIERVWNSKEYKEAREENEREDNNVRYSLHENTDEEFDELKRKAVEQNGYVPEGIEKAKVRVVRLERHPFSGSGKQAIKKAREWAKDNLLGIHTANAGTSQEYRYEIGSDAINKYLSESSSENSENLGLHLATLMKLPEIIENSIDTEIHPDYKKGDNHRSVSNGIDDENMLIHRLYGAATMDGETYRVKNTIKEMRGENARGYDYQITKVELPISGSATSNALGNSTFISVANLLKDVEKSYEKGKKIIFSLADNTDIVELAKKRAEQIDNERNERKAIQAENEKRFSLAVDDMTRDIYEDYTANWFTKFREAYQDRMITLRKVQEELAKTSARKIEDFENAYAAENEASSKATTMFREYGKNFNEPIFAEIKKLIKAGASYDEIKNYVMAKHGLERNEYMSMRNSIITNTPTIDEADASSLARDYMDDYRALKADLENKDITEDEFNQKLDEAREKYTANFVYDDYAGLKGLTGSDSSYKAIAENMVYRFERDHETIDLWSRIKAANEEILDIATRSGELTKEQRDAIATMYDNYVPLRKFNEPTAEEVYDYMLTRKNDGRGGNVVKGAKGRTSKAGDPFANMIQMAENAINNKTKNDVKLAFLKMAMNHPSSLLKVEQTWYVHDSADDSWRMEMPDINEDDSADEIRRKISCKKHH